MPEAIILNFENDGSVFYPDVQPQERPDLAMKCGKEALSRSGFKVALIPGQMQPLFTATIIIAFDKRLFNCEYKVKIRPSIERDKIAHRLLWPAVCLRASSLSLAGSAIVLKCLA